MYIILEYVLRLCSPKLVQTYRETLLCCAHVKSTTTTVLMLDDETTQHLIFKAAVTAI